MTSTRDEREHTETCVTDPCPVLDFGHMRRAHARIDALGNNLVLGLIVELLAFLLEYLLSRTTLVVRSLTLALD